MSLPSQAEVYSQLMEHLRKAQEACATLSHLTADDGDRGLRSQGWMAVSELIKRMLVQVTKLAMKRMN